MGYTRLDEIDWFKWNGVKCTDYGMHVLIQPTIVTPIERVDNESIPGRSGSLTIRESATDDEFVFEDINLSCNCVIDDSYAIVEDPIKGPIKVDQIAKISEWLRGNGNVIFPIRPEGFYKARITNQISFAKIVSGNPHKAFSVQFRCNPSFYLTSGQNSIEYDSFSDAIRLDNPGNIYSEPLIKIVPVSGETDEATIMCGSSTMIITSFEDIDYILVDSETKIAYKGSRSTPNDPLIPLSTRVIGSWLTIPAGYSFLTVTGNVSSIQLTPRWRCV